MVSLQLIVHRAASVVAWSLDKSPEPKDVKAGWAAFAIFLGLLAAVALLGWSLSKQLKKAKAAQEAGVYGEDPAEDPVDSDSR